MADTPPPFYFQLTESLRDGGGGNDIIQLKAAQQRVDRFEKLLRQNNWPLGNGVDVIQRHVDYQRWYPGPRSDGGGDPTTLAYQTLARLATYDEIRYALEHMTRWDPWSGPGDFGDNPLDAGAIAKYVRPSAPTPAPIPKGMQTIERDGFTLRYDTHSLLENLSDADLGTWRNWARATGRDAELEPLWRYLDERAQLQNLAALAQSLLRNTSEDAKRLLKFKGTAKRIANMYNALNAVPGSMRKVQQALVRGDASLPAMNVATTTAASYEDLRSYALFLNILQEQKLSDNKEWIYQRLVKYGGGGKRDVAEHRILRQSLLCMEMFTTKVISLSFDPKYDFALGFQESYFYSAQKMHELIDAAIAASEAIVVPQTRSDIEEADFEHPELDAPIIAWLYADTIDQFLAKSNDGLRALRELDGFANHAYRKRAKPLLTAAGEIPVFLILGDNLRAHRQDAGPWRGYWIRQEMAERVQDAWQRVYGGLDANAVALDPQPLWIEQENVPYVLGQGAIQGLQGLGRGRPLNLNRITWDDNSCWLDSMALALFANGDAPSTRRFLGGEVRAALAPKFHLHMADGQVLTEQRCKAEDVQQFYDLLITDIVQLQIDPVAPQCRLGLRDLWNSCAMHPVTGGAYGEPRFVYNSLRELFGLHNVWSVLQETEEIDNVVGLDGNPNGRMNIDARPRGRQAVIELYAVSTTWSPGYRFRDPQTATGSITYQLDLKELGAVIMLSGRDHFTTFVRDRQRNVWEYINVAPNAPNVTKTEAVLPSHVYTITPANIALEKPVMFLYFAAAK